MSNISSKDVHDPLRLRIDATRQMLQLIRTGKCEKLIRFRLRSSVSVSNQEATGLPSAGLR